VNRVAAALCRALGGRPPGDAPRQWRGRFCSMEEALRDSDLHHYRELAADPCYIASRLSPPPQQDHGALDVKHLGILAALLHCVAAGGGAPIRVLDLGGGLALHHRRLAPMLPPGCIADWSIVELPAVAAAAAATTRPPVRYFPSLDAYASSATGADIALASGVLQTLDAPFDVLRDLARLSRRVVLVSVPLTDAPDDFVAAGEREEPYALWFFSRGRFRARCAEVGLQTALEWQNPDTSWLVNGVRTPPAANFLLERTGRAG
jgi:putative methyltransferase (TIGR04325 family)